MELQIARQIIDTLARGIHPVTGEAMPEDSPYNAAPVLRALYAVSRALEGEQAPTVKAPAIPAGSVLVTRAGADAAERFLSGFEDDTDTGNADFVAAPLKALRTALKRRKG